MGFQPKKRKAKLLETRIDGQPLPNSLPSDGRHRHLPLPLTCAVGGEAKEAGRPNSKPTKVRKHCKVPGALADWLDIGRLVIHICVFLYVFFFSDKERKRKNICDLFDS